jgi:hypothetical protein
MPKSTTFTTSRSSRGKRRRKMFCGFRSRCTTFLAWLAVKAEAIWPTMFKARATGMAPTRRSSLASSMPSRNSMTRKGCPSGVKLKSRT